MKSGIATPICHYTLYILFGRFRPFCVFFEYVRSYSGMLRSFPQDNLCAVDFVEI